MNVTKLVDTKAERNVEMNKSRLIPVIYQIRRNGQVAW